MCENPSICNGSIYLVRLAVALWSRGAHTWGYLLLCYVYEGAAFMHMDQTWERGAYTLSTERSRLDVDVIHGFLSNSYWAQDIPRALVERSLEHSLPFGVYHGTRQVGFARVISDYATFAYIGDVFIIEEYRGKGLSKWLIEMVVGHPELQGLRRWMLLTRDAHGLYQKVGFEPSRSPERLMERYFPDVYQR
jgi:N-acetylglutamate synthase-like GNAT family acetyltransferase